MIFILFFLLNINIKHKNYYEKFEEEEENKYCGKQNDICIVNSSGKTSCCDDYKCILPKGDYQYKICVNKNNIFTDIEKIGGLSMPNLPDVSLPNISLPNISFSGLTLPKFSLPKINLTPNICPAK